MCVGCDDVGRGLGRSIQARKLDRLRGRGKKTEARMDQRGSEHERHGWLAAAEGLVHRPGGSSAGCRRKSRLSIGLSLGAATACPWHSVGAD